MAPGGTTRCKIYFPGRSEKTSFDDMKRKIVTIVQDGPILLKNVCRVTVKKQAGRICVQVLAGSR